MTMNRKARRAAKAGANTAVPSDAWHALSAEALTSLERGDAANAAGAAEALVGLDSRSAEAQYLLATARLIQGQLAEAEGGYRRAILLAPKLAEAHNNLGTVLERQGCLAEALRCYGEAVTHRPGYAEAHNNLGNALGALGRGPEAIAAFQAAIAARSAYPEAWYNLAAALIGFGRQVEAEHAYRQALALRPAFLEALNNLSILLVNMGRAAEAEGLSRQAIRLAPVSPESHYNLGDVLRALGRMQDAATAYRQVIALRPNDADARIAIGNLLLGAGKTDEAHAVFREAQKLRPLTRRAAAKTVADFSVLLLIAPGAANTPIDFLVEGAGFQSGVVPLLPGVEHDLVFLREHGDVVINLISDIDRDGGFLPLARELLGRLGRPVLNHPDRIRDTGRDAIAARLAGIAGCRVPRTVRFGAGISGRPGADAVLAEIPLPLLLRPSGTHGGSAFEKCDDPVAVATFTARHPARSYYATEYVDFSSADGFFRKYRMIFVDGRILPYHLAIDRQWKVHHFRTDMANHEWMRREELAFLENPGQVFGPDGMNVLRAVQAAVGLDYFGIDCGLDRQGRIVVFEVNATMLVHGETGIFAYKQPYSLEIKKAFAAMLAKAASQPRSSG